MSTPTTPAAATFVVLAKAPVPGLVKTRLTTAYSAHEAAALAAAALLDSLDAVAAAADAEPAGARSVVCALTGDLDQAAAPQALRSALASCLLVEQRGGSLGERIAYAHVDAAASTDDSGPHATVQIGMDTPQVDPTVLAGVAERITAPDGPDAVLGLAPDGGWWLLALRRPTDAHLVTPVPMSTSETGRCTQDALDAAGLTVELAPPLSDVDVPADVLAVAAQAPHGRFAALAQVLGDRTAVTA